ncbi:hypothetical protein JZ751_018910, partial [Albula glossodonta]
MEAAHWDREKNKMLDLFSSKLDLLHSHQASTLQELQVTRLELGKVQEMLKPPEAEEERPLLENSNTAQEDQAAEDPTGPEAEKSVQAQIGACGKLPLVGAQARLESLKENLYKREREITLLLQGDTDGSGLEGEQNGISATQPPCLALLSAVIQK